MEKNKIAVIIRGGLVANIYSRDKSADIVIVDFDNQGDDEEAEADRDFREVVDDDTMKVVY